jgi:DNA-binding NarL/FixJ family response regulator
VSESILVVDDEPQMLERLRRILATLDLDGAALRCAGDVASAKTLIGDGTSLAMALIDLGLPDGNGIELIAWLRERDETVPILVISAWSTEEMIVGALRAGASGYILKERDDLEIAMSLKNVLKGGSPIDPFIARRILGLIGKPASSASTSLDEIDTTLHHSLSEREVDILTRVAKGMSNSEIAGATQLSKWTVGTHIRNIYRKLAVKSRTQAVHEARLHGLLR